MTTGTDVFVPTAEDEALFFARLPIQFTASLDEIHSLPNAAAAFVLACRASGLTDKEIYSHIGIDAGYFSNIKTGKATLQADREAAFCAQVGNRIYPEWRAHRLGCTLVVLQSEAERVAAEERARRIAAEERAAGMERELECLKSVMRGQLGGAK